MQLFYNPDLDADAKQLTFSHEESKHIVKILRKSVGDEMHITNGKGWFFKAEISIADIRNCVAKIVSKDFQEKKNPHLHLAVAPTKMNDRYEWFLEKATEIGIDIITPIICDRSERRVVNRDRYEKILTSAMKQSLHAYLPQLKDAVSFKDFIKMEFKGQKFIAHCEETDRKSLKKELKPDENILVLIGPEGDFSPNEIELAIRNGFIPVTLGKTRLRTETAAIVACHSVVFSNEL